MLSQTLRAAVLAAGAMAGLGAATAAQADGYPPFRGYSLYFGGPTTYFTNDETVHEVVRPENGEYGFGTRTYYRGGPFWAYQTVPRRGFGTTRSERRQIDRRQVVLRRRS